MTFILGIGECMIELSSAGAGLWRQGFAGDVFNTLWYARAYSAVSTDIVFHTALGTDPMSDQLIEFAQAGGINCDGIARLENRRPGLYSIHLEDGERSFTYWRDTSAARSMIEHPGQLWDSVARADVVYLSGITLAILPPSDVEGLLKGLARHRKPGSAFVFDPNIRPHLWADRTRMLEVISKAAALCDVVLPSFEDEATAFGDATPHASAKRYAELGAGAVVVKNGGSETLYLSDGNLTSFPVQKIEKIVDTTAAGDSFNGAFIALRASGHSVEDAILAAQDCAAHVIGHKGAVLQHSLLGASTAI